MLSIAEARQLEMMAGYAMQATVVPSWFALSLFAGLLAINVWALVQLTMRGDCGCLLCITTTMYLFPKCC
jgi:hypothetical protein